MALQRNRTLAGLVLEFGSPQVFQEKRMADNHQDFRRNRTVRTGRQIGKPCCLDLDFRRLGARVGIGAASPAALSRYSASSAESGKFEHP